MKRIVVINGHPATSSYCDALKDAYCHGASETGAQVTEIKLASLKFDPILHEGYKTIQPLESDLIQAQEDIERADHIMMIFPVWWGGMPALMKGFIERTFIPTWAFSYSPGALFPNKILSGRSARVIMTMDNYPIIFRLWYGMPGVKQASNMTLQFCGIKPVKVNMFGSVKRSSRAKREKWLKKVKKMGCRDARSKLLTKNTSMELI